MIEQFCNLKSDIPDNQQLALKLNEVICALSAMEAATTAVQRLKAEIAALIIVLCEAIESGDDNKIISAIGKLRQLSAV